jgi:hypothetical protein
MEYTLYFVGCVLCNKHLGALYNFKVSTQVKDKIDDALYCEACYKAKGL